MIETMPVLLSDVYKGLKPKLEEASALLKAALLDSAPIILRHHSDCDGYCGGMALEQALLELQENKYGRPTVSRYSLKAPRYELEDAAADLRTLSNPKLANKRPIVVVIDNGSTSGDEPGLRLLRLYRVVVIVVDHHPIDAIDESLRKVHISPFLVGGNSDFTAGMLCVELAHMINPVAKIQHLAALSGVSDRVSGKAQEGYLKVADMEGYKPELLEQLYHALDYLTYFRGESWTLLYDLLFGEKELSFRLIKLFAAESERLRGERLAALKRHCTIERGATFIEMDSLFSGFSYPPPGRSVGLLYQELKQKDENALVIGLGGSFMTIRGKLPKGLDVQKLLERLSEVIPGISGGGHDVAGTLWFSPADKDKVLAEMRKLLE